MPLPEDERERRWNAARQLMSVHDLDVILAFGDPGDVPAHQRYLSGWRSMYGDAAALLFREDAELIASSAVVAAYGKELSWMAEPVAAANDASIGTEIAKLLADRTASRIGVAELGRLPSGWRDDIAATVPGATFFDVGSQLRDLRHVKSGFELELARTSARIASETWGHMPEILRVGRREYEVLADIEHLLRLNGCEDSFNLVIGVPRLKYPIEARPSARRLVDGDQLTMEISPRYQGYFTQLTALACLGKVDSRTRAAYEAANRAREAGLALMRPGVDLLDVRSAVEEQLRSDGYKLASPMLGHFCGLELDDLRAGATSFELKAGMVFIFHPLLAGFPGMLRGDTYLVTGSGAEPLTTLPLEPLELH